MADRDVADRHARDAPGRGADGNERGVRLADGEDALAVAPFTVKPDTETFEAEMTMPLFCPVALITASWPSSVSGFATVTSSA